VRHVGHAEWYTKEGYTARHSGTTLAPLMRYGTA
jgi:hypothetical protein